MKKIILGCVVFLVVNICIHMFFEDVIFEQLVKINLLGLDFKSIKIFQFCFFVLVSVVAMYFTLLISDLFFIDIQKGTGVIGESDAKLVDVNYIFEENEELFRFNKKIKGKVLFEPPFVEEATMVLSLVIPIPNSTASVSRRIEYTVSIEPIGDKESILRCYNYFRNEIDFSISECLDYILYEFENNHPDVFLGFFNPLEEDQQGKIFKSCLQFLNPELFHFGFRVKNIKFEIID
jgi:hypothetical protein